MFKVFCPGQYNHLPHKLMMYQDGTVIENIKYRNVCSEFFRVHVAYNHNNFYFEIENKSMVDTMAKYNFLHGDLVGNLVSQIAGDSEILSIFFDNYNIIVEWINCNQTWGLYDVETAKWTGAVGQVSIFTYDGSI